MVSVLCASANSNWNLCDGVDVWNKERNAWNFTGRNMCLTFAPCQQWSRLRKFANENLNEKLLAYWCWDIVNSNGGIFEHPMGSYFWKHVGADRKKMISVDQCWFGFPCKKNTYLYFHQCKPNSFPILKLPTVRDITNINTRSRSITTVEFNNWLLSSIGLY